MYVYLESLRALFEGEKRAKGRDRKDLEREKERRGDAALSVSMATAHLHTHHFTSPLFSQLLLYLKEFSQKMNTKTHEIEKQVDTLVHEAKVSDGEAL